MIDPKKWWADKKQCPVAGSDRVSYPKPETQAAPSVGFLAIRCRFDRPAFAVAVCDIATDMQPASHPNQRETAMNYRIMISALLICCLLPLLAAADEGSAKGHMIVNGKTVELTHAYAFAQPDSFHKEKEEVRVILSDAPITDEELRNDRNTLDKRAADGSFHAISIVVGDDMFGDGKRAASDDIYTAEINNGWINTSGLDKFEMSAMDSGSIAGRAHMDGAHEFENPHVTFDYDVTFKAQIIR